MEWGTRRWERRSRVPAVTPAPDEGCATARVSRLMKQENPGVRIDLVRRPRAGKPWEVERRWERIPDGWAEAE